MYVTSVVMPPLLAPGERSDHLLGGEFGLGLLEDLPAFGEAFGGRRQVERAQAGGGVHTLGGGEHRGQDVQGAGVAVRAHRRADLSEVLQREVLVEEAPGADRHRL